MIKTKTAGPRSEPMLIDADMAAEFLKKERPPKPGEKGTNRKSGPRLVAEYAAAMVRGEWKLNHQGIAFAANGDMIDGGHRMRAVILANEEVPGIEVPFMVATGLDGESMQTMDLGKRRVPADYLQMRGEINSTTLAGILRLVYCYHNVPYVHTESWSRFRITPTMQSEFLDANPGLRDSIHETYPLKKLFKPSALGSFWYLATQEYETSEVATFLSQVKTGELLSRGDPALTLRELMLNAKAALRRFEAAEELALLIKAFKKFANREESLLLAFRQDEQFPRL